MKGDGKIATRLGRRLIWVPVALIAFYTAVSWTGWQRHAGQAAGLGARMACSCRYIEGRDLASCRGDLSGIDWMPLVRYSDDERERRVTGSVPLLASRSAKLKDGFGCLPER
ncbi:hypothetical protein [Sphingobium nicotianae]|uniref:Uncharacterized protein n=1 Tax=Sphingobium nicotianae TaxID=2782607 RepID=A0A9X1DB16_9SPHN|nr:hypothetical protein [Sphingobium nicotianae]MBT2186468.1 hypothetical protein [Sphingobium nicotianae]